MGTLDKVKMPIKMFLAKLQIRRYIRTKVHSFTILTNSLSFEGLLLILVTIKLTKLHVHPARTLISMHIFSQSDRVFAEHMKMFWCL